MIEICMGDKTSAKAILQSYQKRTLVFLSLTHITLDSKEQLQ